VDPESGAPEDAEVSVAAGGLSAPATSSPFADEQPASATASRPAATTLVIVPIAFAMILSFRLPITPRRRYERDGAGRCGASPRESEGQPSWRPSWAGSTLVAMTAPATGVARRGLVPLPRVAASGLVAVCACTAAVVFGLYAEHGRQQMGRTWDLALLDVTAGFVFVGAGAAVYAWRPTNRCWWLLVAAGGSWFLGTLAGVGDVDLSTFGFVTTSWHYFFLAHLLLAFPTGRLASRRDVVLLAAFAAVLTGKSLVRLLLFVPPDGTGCGCVGNRVTGYADPRWFDLEESLFPWVISALFAVVVARVVVRWARSSGPGRRILMPVLAMAVAVAAQIGYAQVIRQELAWAVLRSQDLFVLVVVVRSVAAYSVVVGLRRTGPARAAVASVVGELEADPSRLAGALRRALEDPSLELVPVVDGALPEPGPGRAVTVVRSDEGAVAALVHDEALLQDPGLISAVTAAIRLTTDNERLRHELHQRLEDLEASRVRIIEAGDAERRRIERDLHDGTQQRLISIALQLRLALNRDPGEGPLDDAVRTAVDELAGVVQEVRDLARGIHPAILTESGLAAAVESLVDRSPLEIGADLEIRREPSAAIASAAYFCVSEALTNIAKHAHSQHVVLSARTDAGSLTITVTDDGVGGADAGDHGTGLSGMRDRVAAAGGSMTVGSPAGGGTTIHVVLPCA
jgi:signal transduction histidine kinase